MSTRLLGQDSSLDPARHYDAVTEAWGFLLGEELHYGLFKTGEETLEEGTAALTSLMIEKLALEPSMEVLDVGCGSGAPACRLAQEGGVRVTGITTSPVGVTASRERAQRTGVEAMTEFEERDGTDNGFPGNSFDRVLILEASHLMRARRRLLAESARVLRRRGRLALCDIVLRRQLSLSDVRRLRKPLVLLRDVFGDAHMDVLEHYAELAEQHGLHVLESTDLTGATRATFSRWRENADRHRTEVTGLLGEQRWRQFVDACAVLEHFWDDGILGYGMLAAIKP